MTDRHRHLSERMQARRLELGMRTWRALAEEAGISYETLRALRAGENVAPGTADAIERALKWAPGSISTIISGGEPTPADEPYARTTDARIPAGRAPADTSIRDEIAEIREMIRMLDERLARLDERPQRDETA